ncbi:hypothetical protein FRC17_001236 [Serendipita sp. 399]|nr:hypothetical protein FRC17_001236 [Serendipita sp. 399]
MSRSEQNEQQSPVERSYQARVDQLAFNFSPSEAGTSRYTPSSTGQSYQNGDGTSKISTYTYVTDRDAQSLLQEVDGRFINTLSDKYYLPTGKDYEAEWSRLDKQHIALMLGLGGLYPAREDIQVLLAPQEGETKRILDIGCGTGTWAIEMARLHPHCEIVAVDLSPVPVESDALPSNCRFEVDNINMGLAHFYGQFDLIHTRIVGIGIDNFKDRMKDVHQCLKPGGIALWIDADFDLYSTEKFEYHPPASDNHPEGSWAQRIMYELRKAGIKVGSDVDGMESALDAGLWSDPLIDSKTCKTGSLYLPIGTWANHEDPAISQQLKYVGALMRQGFIGGTASSKTFLIKVGWRKETVETWERNVIQELTELRVHTLVRYRLAWGRRKPVAPRSAQQRHNEEEETESSSRSPYPWFYVYDTEEAALEQAEERRRGKANLLPSTSL